MFSADGIAASNLSFRDGPDAITRALQAIRSHLGMQVAYVSEFVGDQSVFRAVDAPGFESIIQPGDSRPLDDVFCRHILEGRLPALMGDVSEYPLATACPIMQEVPIGAHMSVPILMQNGEVYGMFCCLSLERDPTLTARDLKMLHVFADMAAHQIDNETKAQRDRNDKRAAILDVMDCNAFQVVYQPIFDFSKSAPIGFESLCRFSREPYRSPDKWFADAATVDLGIDLELAVMRQALEGARALPSDVYVSVNASAELLLSGRLPALIDAFSDLRIVVEVTEHTIVSDYIALRTAIASLRQAGATIAVDDAGAGYSGLQHIIQVAPDIIKLDISLTRGIDQDPARRALISALIFFARETDSKIVAEGVETEQERIILHALGVTRGQGYLLGRPMPLESATKLFIAA